MSPHPVLPRKPVSGLDAYLDAGGGFGLSTARRFAPEAVIEEIMASGLRGRGGAGFPTGRKWRTAADYAEGAPAPSVVVNGAEGEPGSFKDRTLLRMNPYLVIEGALIAAHALGSNEIVVGLKSSFLREMERLEAAIGELRGAGWLEHTEVRVVGGPDAYLYGEETGLLEVISGRPPLPRVAPPFRRGIASDDTPAAEAVMASPSPATEAAPALVNNVETLANVPGVLARGADAFRRMGTDESPGTVLCTVSGATRRAGVVEVPMGTRLTHVLEGTGGGPRQGRELVAVLPGVSGPLITADHFDVPISYEGFQAVGSSLGAAAFLVFDDETDLVAVAAEVSRFLAVESCGQCTPCKQDGLEIAARLETIRTSGGGGDDLAAVDKRLETVADGALCFLAHQHRQVITSLLEQGAIAAATDEHPADDRTHLVAPIVDLRHGRVELYEEQRRKQPDWSTDETWDGEFPVDVLRR
jgi:NADH:ubiquinone oxidoreductase subunit F (NADH-binding)